MRNYIDEPSLGLKNIIVSEMGPGKCAAKAYDSQGTTNKSCRGGSDRIQLHRLNWLAHLEEQRKKGLAEDEI